MNLGDTFITIFVIILITTILFIFPVIFISNELDSASQVSLQTSMTDFINEICNTGKLTKENYDKFIETITGPNTYNVEIEIKVLDENPSRTVTFEYPTRIGENANVVYYTSQIIETLDSDGYLMLKEGDQVRVYIANTNKTISQILSSPTSSEIATIIAETTQTCTVNGI